MLRRPKPTRIERVWGRFVPANKFCSTVLEILKQWRDDRAVRQINPCKILSQPKRTFSRFAHVQRIKFQPSRQVMGHRTYGFPNGSFLNFQKIPCQAEKQDIHNKRGIQNQYFCEKNLLCVIRLGSCSKKLLLYCFKKLLLSWKGDSQSFLILTRMGITIWQNSASNIFQQDPTDDHGRKEQTERGISQAGVFVSHVPHSVSLWLQRAVCERGFCIQWQNTACRLLCYTSCRNNGSNRLAIHHQSAQLANMKV